MTAAGATALLWRNRTPASKAALQISGSPVRLRLIPAANSDANANLERAVPREFAGMPFTIVAVHGPGDVTISNSILFAFVSAYPAVLDNFAHVSPRGDDSTGAVGDSARPFRTIAQALANASTVLLEDGDYEPFAYYGTEARLVRARNVGRARIVVPGPALQSVQWAEEGGLRVARISRPPHRLIDRARLDREGFPSRLRRHPDAAALRAAESGWCHEGDRLSVKSTSASLAAFFGGGARDHIIVGGGGSLFLHGLSVEGMSCHAERGHLWASHFTSFCAYDYAFQATGGSLYLESGRIHAPHFDGHNVDFLNETGLVVAAGMRVTEVGDFAAFGTPEAFNLQAGSSHSGFALVVACVARRSLGQEYADGALAGAPNHSWYVGNDLGDETYGATDGSYGFYMQGTGDTPRTAYFDTNRVTGVENPLVLELGAIGYLYNNSFTTALSRRGSEAARTYDPRHPDRAGVDAANAAALNDL
ncbi:MAG TPA: hypothetical protein VEX35_11405 [Allosphingosinicella sp.]|nr:hypothetical protein [Allosphingosinicella sp.]